LTVNAVNDSPTVDSIDSQSIDEDNILVFILEKQHSLGFIYK